MKRNKLYLLLLNISVALALSSCTTIDIFKENSEIPIKKPYKSFVIINQEVGLRSFKSQHIDEQVQFHLKEQLESQGLVYNKTKPDLVLRYTSNEDPRKRDATQSYNPYPYWGYRVWDPWLYNPYNSYRSNNSTTTYELVQVIVDFIDPKEDKLLMTLTGVTEVSNEKAKIKKVLKTTVKIIDRFIYELEEVQ